MARIVVFGATSAIAAACARRWVMEGNSLFLIGRNVGKLDSLATDLRVRSTASQRIDTATADLEDSSKHAGLLAQAETSLGGIDIVLVAHGSLPDQKACEQSVDLTMKEINTNALSVVSILTLAANRLEKQGSGTIAVVGSVAGDRGRQSNYVYGSAKGMLDIYTQGLRNRLARKGVAVTTIKPGFVDTPMTAQFEKKGLLWAQPDAVARGIVSAVKNQRDIVYLPSFWRLIMLIIRHVPEAVFKKMSL